jgi:hypothetical protein
MRGSGYIYDFANPEFVQNCHGCSGKKEIPDAFPTGFCLQTGGLKYLTLI